MSSNFSVAFPYIVALGEETMENLLVSEFMEDCGGDLRINNVAFSESCAVEGGNFQKLADLHSVQVSWLLQCYVPYNGNFYQWRISNEFFILVIAM